MVEISRRSFLKNAGLALLGTAVFGVALPESEGVTREANRNELREFLKRPLSGQEVLSPATAEFLSHLRLTKRSEVGWAHNADNRRRVDAFAKDQNRHVAELDCRFDEKRGLYVSHDRGGKSDIDPTSAYEIVVSSSLPKSLKYDFKESEAIGKILESIEDPARSCILNADLFDNNRFGITPQQFVEMSEKFPNALISIGRKVESGNVEDFVASFIKLATDNPGRDFIMPAHIFDFLSSIDELKKALEVPNISLMIYRTSNVQLTQGHLSWLIENFDDATRARTFFDL